MKIPQSCFSVIDNCTILIKDVSFPSGSDSKESACKAGDLGLIPGLGRSPGGGHGNSLQYSCLEYPHGQRSLVSCSPRDHKESDTTERPSTAQYGMQDVSCTINWIFQFPRVTMINHYILGVLKQQNLFFTFQKARSPKSRCQ